MKTLKCILVSIVSILLACGTFILTAGFFTVTNLLFVNSIYVILAVVCILFCLTICGLEKIIKERLKITFRLYVFYALVIPSVFAIISHIIVQYLINIRYYFSGGFMPGFNEYLWTVSMAVVFCGALVGRGALAMVFFLKERLNKGK